METSYMIVGHKDGESWILADDIENLMDAIDNVLTYRKIGNGTITYTVHAELNV